MRAKSLLRDTAIALLLGLPACGSAFSQADERSDAGGGGANGGDSSLADAAPDYDVMIIGPGDATDGSDASDAKAEGGQHPDSGPPDSGPNPGPDSGPGPGPDAGCTLLLCGGQCVPSDVHNCGTCGHSCTNLPHVGGATSCTPGGQCSFGASSCAQGWADCNGSPDDGCEVDVTVPAHCGSCSTACSGSTPVCAASGASYGCVSGCPASKPTLCTGSCVDVTSDPNNCNGCGKSCPGVTNGQPQCASSACTFSCNSNFHKCGSACADNTSINSCGTSCTPCSVPTANAHATCDGTSCGWACDGGYGLCGGNACDPLAGGGAAFVSAGKTGDCSAGNPCGSIQQGITWAHNHGYGYVYVAGGTYSEQLTLQAGITVQGGWGDAGALGFIKGCSTFASAVTIQAPSNVNATVLAQSGGAAGLDTLSIKSKATAGTGESLYGVFVTGGTTLTMTNVSVNVANAGAGTNGTASSSGGSNGSASGCGQAGSDGANGGTGSGGSPGAPQWSASGYSSANGGTGGTGASGHLGTSGGAGQTSPSAGDGICFYDSTELQCNQGIGPTTADPGQAGCPGTGGSGGTGGAGGGSSVALYVWGATVSVTGGLLGSGAAGNGGAGGGGASGGSGAAGVAGASANNYACQKLAGNTCKTVVASTIAGGAAGGTGGNGGTGGQGGGGAGGYSYSYYQGGGAAVSTSGTTLTIGNAGMGGAGGNPGPNGAASQHN